MDTIRLDRNNVNMFNCLLNIVDSNIYLARAELAFNGCKRYKIVYENKVEIWNNKIKEYNKENMYIFKIKVITIY